MPKTEPLLKVKEPDVLAQELKSGPLLEKWTTRGGFSGSPTRTQANAKGP